MSNAFSYFQELEALKTLNEEQCKAFLDLLVFATLADGKITEIELNQFDEELMRLPFLWDDEIRDRVIEHSANTRDTLEEQITDHDYVNTFIDDLATRIVTNEHRELGLRMFVAIVISDGMNELERNCCIRVADAFGRPKDEVDKLAQDLVDTFV